MKYVSVLALCSVSFGSYAEMQLLDEAALSGVTGQAGITVDIKAKVEIDELRYTDDGHPLSLEGISIHQTGDDTETAQSYVMVDVTEGGELQLRQISENTHIQVDEIRVDSLNTAPDSFGTFAIDFDMENYFQLKGGGLFSSDAGMTISQYNSRIFGIERDADGEPLLDGEGNVITKGAELFYRDNGNDLMVSFDYETWGTDWTLDVVADPYKPGQQAILITNPDHHFNLVIDRIKFKTRDTVGNNFTSDPNNSGLDNQANVGMITASADMSGELYISAGGKDPVEGLTFNFQQSLTNGDFRYIDTNNNGDKYELALTGVDHSVQVTNLTFDVIDDYLQLSTERLEGTVDIENIFIGTPYGVDDTSKVSMGSVHVDYLFEDQVANGQTYTNTLKLNPKGNQYGGDQGITIDTSWSLVNADIGYTDNGNTVWVSGIQSYGSGVLTFDLINASYLYANNIVDANADPFFDGVRIGFEDVVGHYSIDGLRVGAEGEDKNSLALQGGTELLLPLQIFQEADFTLNGNVTILPGSLEVEEGTYIPGEGEQNESTYSTGLTINGDLHFTDTTFGISVDSDGSGLWLDDVTYDISMRNSTLNVDDRGVILDSGLYVSNMDIGNVRLGEKNTGESLGRVVISTLENNSLTYIRSGGAGGVCIGASGGQSSCVNNGGRWEDRGDEGVTIGINAKFIDKDKVESDSSDQTLTQAERHNAGKLLDKINSIDPNADTKLGWYRSDGKVGIEAVGISTDDEGLTVELAVDVAETAVKGIDTNDGLLKRVLIDGGGQEVFVNDGDVEARLLAGYTNPLGFAVDTKVEFKQLNIDSINMNHHVGGAQPIFYGAQFENVSLRANITATPIR
ncbi:DUF6160 family protein [Litoribacillus peritrichatus]|uniref:DUF6160 domain-containing protein n=1 Tax=Litoribacillus peritrichatus TaxID=718191 RepID=A0ABP7MIY9_9GAMM